MEIYFPNYIFIEKSITRRGRWQISKLALLYDLLHRLPWSNFPVAAGEALPHVKLQAQAPPTGHVLCWLDSHLQLMRLCGGVASVLIGFALLCVLSGALLRALPQVFGVNVRKAVVHLKVIGRNEQLPPLLQLSLDLEDTFQNVLIMVKNTLTLSKVLHQTYLFICKAVQHCD